MHEEMRGKSVPSKDFLRLAHLIYFEHWEIVDRELGPSKNRKNSARVVLERDGMKQEMRSSSEDFVGFVRGIRETVDAKGQIILRRIRDRTRYSKDTEYLHDPKGEKLRAAEELISAGKFQWTFDPFEGISKILRDPVRKTDRDIRGVKDNYYETCAYISTLYKYSIESRRDIERKIPKIIPYSSIHERILRNGFIRTSRIMDDCRIFLDSIDFDAEDLARRVLEQLRYCDFLMDLMIERRKVDFENGIRGVVDGYWRMCEVCRPYLSLARTAIELRQGKRHTTGQNKGFKELVCFLRNDPNFEKLVECVDPVVRNSEAHCATRVVIEKGIPQVVALDYRGLKARVLARIPFSGIHNKWRNLKLLLLALYPTFRVFYFAFLIRLLKSPEFKLRLVTIDQY